MAEKDNKSIANAEPLSADLQAALAEIRENVRAMRQRGADADGRLALLEWQPERAESMAKERQNRLMRSAECLRETMETRIQIAKTEMQIEFSKTKAEIMTEFYETKSEMMRELYRTKTEISADLYAEHTRQMADLGREVRERQHAAISTQKPAAKAPPPDGRERN